MTRPTCRGCDDCRRPTGEVNLRVNPQRFPNRLLRRIDAFSFSRRPRSDVVKALNDRRVTILSFDLLHASRRPVHGRPFSQPRCRDMRRLEGATHFDRFFPLLTTAAARFDQPSPVMAWACRSSRISTAKRLGAKVRAYDVRSAAKEEPNRPARSS